MSTQSSVVGVRPRLTRPAAGRMNAGRSEHVTTARHLRRPLPKKQSPWSPGGHESSLDPGERSRRITNEADIAAAKQMRSGGKSGHGRTRIRPSQPDLVSPCLPAGTGKDRLEADRLPLSVGQFAELDQIKEPGDAGPATGDGRGLGTVNRPPLSWRSAGEGSLHGY
jgi:hypothetical protein